MKKLMFVLVLASCGKGNDPMSEASKPMGVLSGDAVALADDVSLADAASLADAVSPADAPSAVTP